VVESFLHKSLVDLIVQWINNNSIGELIIYVDSDSSRFSGIPPRIDSFIPDVFAKGVRGIDILVGEAKSSQRDLESEHSDKQLTAYLKYCQNKPRSMVLLAVPLDLCNCAKSLIESKKRQNQLTDVETKVLSFV
jgi:hypothetical protein